MSISPWRGGKKARCAIFSAESLRNVSAQARKLPMSFFDKQKLPFARELLAYYSAAGVGDTVGVGSGVGVLTASTSA